jgi:hypothetical protein
VRGLERPGEWDPSIPDFPDTLFMGQLRKEGTKFDKSGGRARALKRASNGSGTSINIVLGKRKGNEVEEENGTIEFKRKRAMLATTRFYKALPSTQSLLDIHRSEQARSSVCVADSNAADNPAAAALKTMKFPISDSEYWRLVIDAGGQNSPPPDPGIPRF